MSQRESCLDQKVVKVQVPSLPVTEEQWPVSLRWSKRTICTLYDPGCWRKEGLPGTFLSLAYYLVDTVRAPYKQASGKAAFDLTVL